MTALNCHLCLITILQLILG